MPTQAPPTAASINHINLPRLECSDQRVEQAFRSAVGDILGNVALGKIGVALPDQRFWPAFTMIDHGLVTQR